ncbi:MAG: SDR family NAD(P)-dependent oxidoreductase [Pyrinomonadaceae bacterium]
MELAGKKVIVTGGVRGLGRALVEKLLACDASVTVFDLDASGFDELKRKNVNCVMCDVSDLQRVNAAASEYHNSYGPVDVLVNNAGLLYSEPLIKVTGEGLAKHDASMWNKILASNLSSVFYMTASFVEKMITTRTRGVIVNVSSVSAAGNAGQSVYSAAKAGVNALTVVWAKELGPLGIRVVAVAPGFTDTASTREVVSEGVLREIVKKVAVRRLGKPEEIADGIIFVINNDFFNGKVLELDGGLVI